MYGEVKGVVEKGLNDISDVAITTDAWTSLATESYVTVMVHYITKEWQMKSAVLDTSELDERHSAENLAIRLELVKADWNLEGKIRVCVRDNAFNQAAARRLIDDWEDLPCFAHTLQLAVNAGFAIEEVNELIKKSGKLVGFFKKSTSASTALESAQECYKVVKHRLIQSCKTRWNSVYEMFHRLDEQKQCVQAVLSDRSVVTAAKEESLSLTAAQWNKIASLLPVLEGQQIATTAMSSEQNVSVSCVLPVVNGLKNNFLKMVHTDSALLKNFKSTVPADLSRRFLTDLGADSIIALAACMDPRHNSLKSLKEPLRLLVHEHTRNLVDEIEAGNNANMEDEEQPPAKKPAMSLLLGEDYFDEQQSFRDEFTSYIEEPPLHPNCNPLQWWMRNEERFPKVAAVARRYLCAPSTSVPSERVFSATGNIVTKKQCSLLPENANCLVFLNKNLSLCEK